MPGRKADVRYLTAEEVAEAVHRLSSADVYRLMRFARRVLGLFGARDPNSDRDAVHEVVLRMMDERWQVPAHHSFMTVFFKNIIAIVHRSKLAAAREPAHAEETLAGVVESGTGEFLWGGAGSGPLRRALGGEDPAAVIAALDEVEAVLAAFDDPVERKIVLGMLSGLEGGELEAFVGSIPTRIQFASRVRNVRRQLEQMYEGWNS
ncbi:MAG: hypothetical protein EPO51_08350 [Phenylobacterium sp.]|uniref:hypothetical protein n=1 Tax=Phenylobacterium sp. TaxID=1871053 RepID=UPI0012101935|nr:hypothetical protein [Phenylobacterium sp.]TAJ72119.1 MAG: hypothetical protein EPO51_08350 [Phenylobacterium sp.]